MKVRNIDALGGSRELPDHGLVVANGAEVEVPNDLGKQLIEQTSVWERADKSKESPQEQGDKK